MINDEPPAQPVEASFRRLLEDIKSFARREPTQAVAAAFGIGLLINLLPARAVSGTAAAVGATLMRPALLSLGVIKAVELCCQNCKTAPRA